MQKITLLTCAMLSCMMAHAQRTPNHPLDIKDARYNEFPTYFNAWKPGETPNGISKIDDEFYKSRVRPLERIKEGDYYVDNSVDHERKLCMWVPMDDPSTQWKSLPRYCFEGDNFSLWSYVDIHGNWTSPWVRSAAGLTDVAHKNGVKVGCVMSIGFGAGISLSTWASDTHSRVLGLLTKKNSKGKFENAEKLVKFMKYYGVDGIGVNSEFHTTPSYMAILQDFFAECHKKAKELNCTFQVHWYDGTGDDGGIHFDGGLGTHNSKMFGTGDNIVTDMMFANYNWYKSQLDYSEQTAKTLNRSSYDYYAGFDIQGRAFENARWGELLKHKISVGLWGAHAQSLLHQSATDDGTSDLAIQKAYLLKQELAFSGGYHNPALRPYISTSSTLANASLKGFHGLASFITAKSTIQQMPFVSRFNLGNGLSFRNEGKTTFDHKWYNIGTQDFMPTWRWWITGDNDKVDANNYSQLVKAELTFDDAYFGGSCLRLYGKTNTSRVKLFKTMLDVKATDKLSVIYKVMHGTDTHAKVFVSLKDHLTEYKDIVIPAAQKEGEWATFETPLSALGITDASKVVMIGVAVDNTPENYDLHIGELALRNETASKVPDQPKIKEIEVLRGRYNAVDFKMRYASKEESGEMKTFNDEVGTWYYEILFEQKGQPARVLTATPSWAAYVIDAPLVNGKTDRTVRFGVRAVAPDGVTKSEIDWSKEYNIEYNDPLNTIVIDKAVIKPGETFTMKFEDELHAASKTWKIMNAQTGATVKTFSNLTSTSLSLEQEGSYDLAITDQAGKEEIIRGKIQITPKETGAVPTIESITSDKATTEDGINVTYTAKATTGEGKVSRGLVIADPNMLQIPAKMQEGMAYSYALWVKPEKFSHDKQGTNLINKNSIHDKWPHNNWGDLWVTIRPQSQGATANEVSFNTMGWTEHDSPRRDMMATNYGMTPGVWMHVVVTQDKDAMQQLYINGKRIQRSNFIRGKRRETYSDGRIDTRYPADIFIGGGGVYKAGLNGVIDEVQVWNKELTDAEVLQAMKGYKEGQIPDGLQAYYTFETKNSDGTFPNLGKGGTADAKLVALVGSGGENTSTASHKQQNADNNVTGYPGIAGTLDIKAEYMWTLDGAQVQSQNDNNVVVTYSNIGTKGATVTVKNQWGEASTTVSNLVEITASAGIHGVEEAVDFAVYPNPFVESVNLRFAEAGAYTLNILNTNGALVQSNRLTTGAGQTTHVEVTGAKGLYILQVVKDGKTYKTIKLVKQ